MEIKDTQIDNQLSLEKQEKKLELIDYMRMALADYQNAYENLKWFQQNEVSGSVVEKFLENNAMQHGICYHIHRKSKSAEVYTVIDLALQKQKNYQGYVFDCPYDMHVNWQEIHWDKLFESFEKRIQWMQDYILEHYGKS
jgi:hypothetical protein